MSDLTESQVSIRIFSKKYTCTEISTILNLTPTRQHKKETPLTKGNLTLREESLWIYNIASDKNTNIEKHIEKAIELIKSQEAAIQELLPNSTIDLFCGYTTKGDQGGFILQSKLLKDLCKFNIDIIFELYVL